MKFLFPVWSRPKVQDPASLLGKWQGPSSQGKDTFWGPGVVVMDVSALHFGEERKGHAAEKSAIGARALNVCKSTHNLNKGKSQALL